MTTYIRYLGRTVLKKVSLYIIAAIYILLLIAFFCVIPTNTQYNFVQIWRIALMPIMFIVSILAAVIVVYIYKAPQDDGSELVVCSKPMERKKMIWAKLVVSGMMFLFYSAVTCIGCLFALIPHGVSAKGIGYLILCCFVGNLVNFIFFGALATFFSVYWNKIVVIIMNVIIIVLMLIYDTVTTVVSESVYSKITKNNSNVVLSSYSVDKKNNVRHSGYIIPTDISYDNPSELSKIYLDGEKETFNEAKKESGAIPLTVFDFYGHLKSTYFLGPIEKADEWNSLTETSFGARLYDGYSIDNLVHSTTWSNTDLTDDNYSWTSFASSDEPYLYIDTSDILRQDTYSFMEDNSLEQVDPTGLISDIIDFESGINVCYDSDSTAMLFGNLDYVTNNYGNTNKTYPVGYYYDGVRRYSNQRVATNDFLTPTKNERDVFEYLLYEILWDSSSTLYSDAFSEAYPGDHWCFHLKSDEQDPSKSVLLYRRLYEATKPGETLGNNIQSVLHLNSLEDYGNFYMKFRYFIKQELTGVYGVDENYTCRDYGDSDPTATITVPWKDYFKFVFLPMYNSLNCRNYEGLNDDMLGINFKILMGNGFIPIPEYDDGGTVDVISALAYDSGYTGTKLSRFLPQYDGTATPESSDVTPYEVYVNTNVEAQYGDQKTGVYGYYSPLGLKASSLMSNFVDNNDSNPLIYYDNDWYSAYESFFYGDQNPLLLYENTIFNYSQESLIPAWGYILIYLSISLCIYAIAYTKFIHYDFK